MNQQEHLTINQPESIFSRLKGTNTQIIIVLLLILVFLLRLSLSTVMRDPEKLRRGLDADAWWYIGVQLAEGRGYIHYDKEPTAQRGPVPVLIFAGIYKLVGSNRLAVLSLLWLFDVGTAWLIFLIARRIFKSNEVGLLAMLAFAFYLPEIRYTTRAHSEPIGTFLIACCIFSLLKAKAHLTIPWFVAAGVSMGLTILTRPIMAAFPAVVLLILITWPALRQSPKMLFIRASIFTIAIIITIMPWVIRNYLLFRAFIPTSTLGGYNLYIEHYRLGASNYTELTFADPAHHFRYIDPESKAQLIAKGVKWQGEYPDWNEHEFDRFYAERGWTAIKQYPLRYLHLSVLRFFRLWFNVGYGQPSSIESYIVLGTHLLLLSLVFTAYFVYGGIWRKEATLLVGLLIYTTITHMAVHALVRYVIPVIPYVLILASYAVIRSIQSLKESNLAKKMALPIFR